MDIQSFSIVVPARECINKCPFCVSRMVNSNTYPNLLDINDPHYDINVKEYLKKRMRFVADKGCRTLMLTGTAEPQQNKQFLNTFALLHEILGKPFTNIEMQTTGMLLDNRDYLRFLRNFVGVNTIALSVNSPSESENNELIGHPENVRGRGGVKLQRLCKSLREYDFNIRICFNLNKRFSLDDPDSFFRWTKEQLLANQVTFRKLHSTEADTPQNAWIRENQFEHEMVLKLFLEKQAELGKTIYGSTCYDVNGVSVIYDTDCMGKNPTAGVVKYFILCPNCKLYSAWDTPASLIF